MKKELLIIIGILWSLNLTAQQPYMDWTIGIGGTSSEEGKAIATDANGNVYTVGVFTGTIDFNLLTGLISLTSNGSNDLFIHKTAADGTLIWAKQIGGAHLDEVNDIAVDAGGDVYVTGSVRGMVDFDPDTGVVNLNPMSNSFNAFILKLNTTGSFVWAKHIDGPSGSVGNGIDIDGDGNVYTTGWFSGLTDFDPSTNTFNITSFSHDIFVLKLDVMGNFVWVKNMRGTSTEQGKSIAVDANKNIYTTGFFTDTLDFDLNGAAPPIVSAGGYDMFVQKLDSNGNFLWGKGIGGADSEEGKSIAVDANGNVYTTGYFSGAVNFDPNGGMTWLSSAGNIDAFVQKLDPMGNLEWATSMGGYSHDWGYDITVDASGASYVTGRFEGTVDFNPSSNAVDNLVGAGGFDGYVQKLDAAGNFKWARSIGGLGYDFAYGVAVDLNGNVFTTGSFSGTVDFDPSQDTASLTAIAPYDVFVQKWALCTLDISTTINNTTITANNSNATYQWLDCNNNNDTISGATGQSFTATANGDYAVVITENGCVDTSSCVNVIVTSLHQSSQEKIQLYPNPNNGIFTLDLGTEKATAIRIYNMQGQEVYTDLNVQKQRCEFKLAAGLYWLKIALDNEKEEVLKVLVR